MFTKFWDRKGRQSRFWKQYKEYNSLAKELNQTILTRYTDQDSIRLVSRLMGIKQGKTLVFESEEELNFLMDFSLFEYQVKGRTFLQRYQAEMVSLDPKVAKILEADLLSYTSLFKIIDLNPNEISVKLSDLLNPPRVVKILNINLSRTGRLGFLIFTRIIPLEEFNTTSGMYAVFSGDSEKTLLKRYKVLEKRVHSEGESARRLIAFLKLNRSLGIEVRTVEM